jgi:penicillin-binding protein 2
MESSNPWHAAWSPYATSIIYQGIFANQDYDEAVRSLGLQYVMPATTGKENEATIQP